MEEILFLWGLLKSGIESAFCFELLDREEIKHRYLELMIIVLIIPLLLKLR